MAPCGADSGARAAGTHRHRRLGSEIRCTRSVSITRAGEAEQPERADQGAPWLPGHYRPSTSKRQARQVVDGPLKAPHTLVIPAPVRPCGAATVSPLHGSAFLVRALRRAVRFRTKKHLALLIYLTVEAKPHRRERLAELLWPDVSPTEGRHSLATALSTSTASGRSPGPGNQPRSRPPHPGTGGLGSRPARGGGCSWH